MLQLKVCQSGEEEKVYPLYSQQRAIAKYASECGNTAAVRHFSKVFFLPWRVYCKYMSHYFF